MKDLEDWAAVQKVYKTTNSKRATAKILGISRNTVKKLLKQTQAPVYQRTEYNSKLDPYKEQIYIWRCDPYCFNGTRIYRELKVRGYAGSIGPVYRFLRRLDEDVGDRIHSKATTRHESPPGDQAQFDWSEYNCMVNGKIRKVYCFAMILAASRKKAVCFSYKSDADAIYEAIQELFDDLGGTTLELLIDNPKALVIDNNPKSEDEIRYNPHALLLAKHLGIELNACPCYWPRKKGKIERPFSYIEEQFIKGNSFASMEDLNQRGKSFVDEWCNEKHGTTKRIPNQHYLLEEKQTLGTLPENHLYQGQSKQRVVSPDSFVSFEGNKYSVPVKYACKKVYIRVFYGYRLQIYDKNEALILELETLSEKGQSVMNPEHYEAIASKTATSIPQIRRDFTERFTNGAKYLDAASRSFEQPTHHARKIMELLELYEAEILDQAIAVAIEENRMDIKGFRLLMKEYNAGLRSFKKNEDSPSCTTTATDALTRDCDYYEKLTQEAMYATDNAH
ncbi:IS21 family transposase [Mediterraneibacter gnavus]|uniref:IS21 family transposase n=1 Tax=Mediterraneibacter gnavus TaxID=33038 RepID=UPI0015E0CC31|nr:IS21 family transposase [Mediterraneibacter gnavus]